MRAASAAATLGVGLAAAAQAPPEARQAEPKSALVYVGNASFAPFEYLDDAGQPQGFNVALVRALSREAGVEIQIRLGVWSPMLHSFERGRADLISLPYSDAQDQRYDLIERTWTLRQSLLFPASRAPLPRPLELPAGDRVAVEDRSLAHQMFLALPQARRPQIRIVPDPREAVRLVAEGGVEAAAGNELSLRVAAGQVGLAAFSMAPVKTVTYHLATQKGRREELAWVSEAFDRLRAQGQLDLLVERYLASPEPLRAARELWLALGVLLALLLLGALGAALWTRSLRARVARETRRLSAAMLEQQRLADEGRRADDALRASEAHLRSILDNMLGGLITVDTQGVIVSLNASAERMFGYRSHELLGRHLSVLVPPASGRDARAFLRSAFSRAIGRVTEWEGLRKGGEVFPFELSMFEFPTPAGRHFAGSIRDISERREVERLKKEFVSTVSHELRTPLTSIRGSLGLLAGGALGELSDEARELVTIAERNCVRLIALINDILDLERLESGRLDLRIGPEPLQAIVERSLESVRPLAEQHAIELHVAPTQARILADHDRIVQVVVNLLSNAVKFSQPGSRVSITCVQEAQWVELRVTDQGRGIPASLREVIFERFQQVEASDARKQSGSGLGLAICRAIVEQHGGVIGVDSEEGRGSTFWFRVRPAPTAAAGADQIRRVVVLDGVPERATRLALTLAQRGHVAETATEPTAACDGFSSGEPAVLLVGEPPAGTPLDEWLRELRARLSLLPLPLGVLGGLEHSGRLPQTLAVFFARYRGDALLDSLQGQIPERDDDVLLVDDDEALLGVMSRQLLQEGIPVRVAATASDALREIERRAPALLVLDLQLPGETGRELVARLQRDARHRGLPLFIYTVHDLSHEELDALRLGPTRYLTKSRASDQEFLAVVRELLGRASPAEVVA